MSDVLNRPVDDAVAVRDELRDAALLNTVVPLTLPTGAPVRLTGRQFLGGMVEPERVDQRENGCLMACVSTITGIPLDELPHPPVGASEDWFDSAENRNSITRPLQETLVRNGWFLVHLWKKVPRGYAIAGGTSPRGLAIGHAVVVKDGQLWHDPHPSRAGLSDIEGYDILVPIIPPEPV